MRATGRFDILDAIEAQCGRVAYVVPTERATGALHARLAEMVKEFGETLETSGAALADGRLDATECGAVVRQVDEAIRVMCQFREAAVLKARIDEAA